jgi:Zn-dependent protease with chaperone function
MTRQDFDKLVRRVEDGVGRRPVALAWRVALLALAGYAGLLVWLAVVVGISAGFYAAMFWVELEGKILCGVLGTGFLFGGGYAALRALLVRLEPPAGRPVTPAETPRLFAVLADLRKRLHSTPFHQVLIVADCNAGVVQIPRLGALGWSRNYLLLGLPLLDGLSVDEMRAVLAHEFTHLSRDHGRFFHWLYRLRRSWEEVFKELSRPQVRAGVSLRAFTVKFVDWFWPRFNAHAFVLSRANEYEADAQAARLAGAANVASSLLRVKLHSRWLENNHWPAVWQQANAQPEPPGNVFVRIRDGLRAGLAAGERVRWLNEAFRMVTTNSDTHPCFAERLRAIGFPPDGVIALVSVAPAASAAEALLGGALEGIRADVQNNWQKEVETIWRERHARASALSSRLAALEEAMPNMDGDVDGLWDKAAMMLDLHTDREVEPLLRRILALRPGHGPANFHLGRILLDAGRAEGEACLGRVMTEDEASVPQACALLRDYYRRTGRHEKLREIDVRLDRYEKDLEASRLERREVSARDTLLPHDLSAADLEDLRRTLAAEPRLARAALGRKELRYFPKQRLFLLCVRRRSAWHRLPSRDRDQELVQRLMHRVHLPGRVLVFAPRGAFRALARKLARVPGSEIYPQGP